MATNPLKLKQIKPHLNFPEMEEKVLAYWDQTDAFNRSVAERPEDNPFVFYDGPPFATGTPHYGHLLGSVMKDIIPRFWTMKGYRVERVWGWDCHGLPIENMIEQELGLKGGKKGIEAYGIGNFNDACRSAILRFDTEWEKVIRRIGRWVDMKHSYKTMDVTYMESVWWAFKQLFDKDLVYQGRKVILYCPRCSTPLSNFEIAMDNSYRDVTDHSITIKCKLVGKTNEYLLAWTTTPWTLIGNVALAVDSKATYVKINQKGDLYYLAKDRLSVVEGDFQVVAELKGQDLVGTKYERLFDYLPVKDEHKAFYVAAADFVSMEEGTGIVHTAAMYGEDDYQLALKVDLPLIDMLDDQGKFMEFATPIKGEFYKKAETWIVEDLVKRGLMYHAGHIIHSYPFCYRCGTPLYYNAVPAWFIDIQKLKPELIQNNQAINWYPKHLKHGRFGKGLQTAPDWNISRSRYWGTPMPIWVGEGRGQAEIQMRVIGSRAELRQWAVDPDAIKNLDNLHRQYLDDIEVWVDDNKSIKGKRIPEVFDCWVESGSMSFAADHYPFENKQKFEARFPAQYIVEYIAQTRAWFYTLHVMATAIFGKPAFQNALTTGTIMAADGSKMSKSKKNFPDPMEVVNAYGVDSLRLYFASSPLMKTAENVNFNRGTIDEIRKKVFVILWNVFAFYKLYDDGEKTLTWPKKVDYVLDRWLISELETLTQTVTESLEHYDVVTASRALMDFIPDFSQWWLRLSRDRLRDARTNAQVLQVFRAALYRLSLLLAPFAPFFAEVMYQNLPGTKLDSIHLESWPESSKKLIDDLLRKEMTKTRSIVEKIHAKRKFEGIPLRQPLGKAIVLSDSKVRDEVVHLLEKEVNIKQILWMVGFTPKGVHPAQYPTITLTKEDPLFVDIKLTPDLQAEGDARKLIRQIMDARKKQGFKVDAWINLTLPDWPKAHEAEIKAKVKAKTITRGDQISISKTD